MTTKELIKRLEEAGLHFNGLKQNAQDEDLLDFSKGNAGLCVAKNLIHRDCFNGLTISEWKVVFEALVDYADTPLEQRNEPKYRVRLRGFNSVNVHQYLAADREDVKTAKFFACTERPDLKQEFTQEELDIIANRNQFKGVGWLQDLIRHAEPVEDD